MRSEIACYDGVDFKKFWSLLVQTLAPTVAARRRSCDELYPNSLEPLAAIEAFINHPPLGFTPRLIKIAEGMVPAFSMQFDLLTTLDETENSFTNALKASKLVRRFCTLPTLFAGTTTSEYALYPAADDYSHLLGELSKEMRLSGSQLLIIKDIPDVSPLLVDSANVSACRLMHQCRQAGFAMVSGQALAYIPIDFASIDEYFSKYLSYSRRKEFRRKLKAKACLEITEMRTGQALFADDDFLDQLYRLYLNVYQQSKYHFDLLSREYFAELLQDGSNAGVVFVYKRDGVVIGYNLCFVQNDCLVDKYVGFAYPAARDNNLYSISWFTNLEFALKHNLRFYIAGWTDPEIKTALGASFTFTRHAVYVRNPLLRAVLQKFQRFFEPDANLLQAESGKSKSRVKSAPKTIVGSEAGGQ